MKKVWFALCILLLLVAVSSYANGANVYRSNPYCVFITYPEGRYVIGYEMEFKAQFFFDGESIDPLWVNMSTGYHDEEMLWYNMTRVNKGIYALSLTLAPEHLDEDRTLWVSAIGQLDRTLHERENIRELVYISTEYSYAFGAEYSIPDPSDMAPRPGQVVEFDVWTTYLGTLVDPDEGTMAVGVSGPGITWSGSDVERVGTGHYQGSFTVPLDMESEGSFRVGISANYTRDGFTCTLPISIFPRINVHLFSIWINQKFVNETMTILDLYVTDLEGDPVAGAMVYLEDEDLTGTTNESGVYEFTLSYTDVEPGDFYYRVNGYVEKDGLRQSLTEYCSSDPYVFIISPEPEPRPPRESSWSTVLDDELPEDSDVSIRLQSYHGDQPLAGDRIIVSVSTHKEILYYGDGTTGADGILSVPVHTPRVPEDSYKTYIDISYQRLRDDGSWSGWDGNIDIMVKEAPSTYLEWILDNDCYIDVRPFEAGDTIEAWVTVPEADGFMEVAGAIWGLGGHSIQGAPGDPAWISWIPRAHHERYFKGHIVGSAWEDGKYKVTIDIPNFIPEDEELYIVGFVRFLDSVGSADIKYALVLNVTPGAVDQPPKVAIARPEVGGVYNGTIDLHGTAIDDLEIIRIEVSIDGGAWSIAVGTTEWTQSLNTVGMPPGDHTIQVRAWDIGTFTERSITFVVDQPPSVTVNNPVDDVVYSQRLDIHGTAEDDLGILKVEFRIDGGEWMVADGTDGWSYTIDTRNLDDGTHTLECRAFDMYTSSRTVTVEFNVDNPEVKVSTPGLQSTIVVLAFLSVAGTLISIEHRKRR